MKKRDEEPVVNANLVSYEEFVERLHSRFPTNCLLSEEDGCPYRDQLKNSETVYLKLYDENGNEITENADLLAVNPEKYSSIISEIKQDENGQGYLVSYNKELEFSEPYSNSTIYNNDKDKYTIMKKDCSEFSLDDYEFEIGDKNNIILKSCNAVHNIYIPKTVDYDGRTFFVEIEYSGDNLYVPVLLEHEFASIKNPFFKNQLSVKNLVIENGVKIRCTYKDQEPIDTDASYICTYLLNLEYAKLPKEITKANYAFAFCVSLKAVSVDTLPYEANGMFFECEALEDLSYIKFPDDGSKSRRYILGNCKSLKTSDKMFTFYDDYTKPVYLSDYLFNCSIYDSTVESFKLPDIPIVSSYRNFLYNMPYLTNVSGSISKYTKDMNNFLHNTPNVSGFININSIWFDHMIFTNENTFNTCENSIEFKEPLVLIPIEANKYYISEYVNTLPKNCNVYVQDSIESYTYDLVLGKYGIEDTVILRRYNGYVKRLYIPDYFKVNGRSYRTEIYSGSMIGHAVMDTGCFTANIDITHIAVGDNIKFTDNNLQGLFFGCENLIHGIDMVYGDKYDYMYTSCYSLEGCYYIDNTNNITYEYLFYKVQNTNNIYIVSTKEATDITVNNYFKNSCLYNLIESENIIRTIDKNNKKYVVLYGPKNSDFSDDSHLWIPKYFWYNGKKYYTCFRNPDVTVNDNGFVNTIDGFFQILNSKGYKSISFSPIKDLYSDNIVEFEDDNMDYMFYGCTQIQHLRMINFSQNITSAAYSFFNSGILFTKFNFGVVDVRYACALDTNRFITYRSFDKDNVFRLPNSIKYMEYFMTNYDINTNFTTETGDTRIKPVIPYSVQSLDFSFFLNCTFLVDTNTFIFYDDEGRRYISRLPLIRLRKANYAFKKLSPYKSEMIGTNYSYRNLNIPIASNRLFVQQLNEYILPNDEAKITILDYNYTKDDYAIIDRSYVNYNNATFNITGTYATRVKSMELKIDFSSSKLVNGNVDNAYIRIFGKDVSNKFNAVTSLIRITRSNLDSNYVYTYTYTPGNYNLNLGAEVVVLLKYSNLILTNSYNLTDRNEGIIKPWYRFNYSYLNSVDEENSLNLNLVLWNNNTENNYKDFIQGHITYEEQDEVIYLDEDDLAYQSILLGEGTNESDVSSSFTSVTNYIPTSNSFETISGTNRIKVMIDTNRLYRVNSITISGYTSNNLTVYVYLACEIIDGNGNKQLTIDTEPYAYLSNPTISSSGNIDMSSLRTIYATDGNGCLVFEVKYNSTTTSSPTIKSISLDTDINYYPYQGTEFDEAKYLIARFIVEEVEWKYITDEQRYLAIVDLEGSSEIPDSSFTCSSNIEEEVKYIDKVIPKNGCVYVYTTGRAKPTSDMLIDLTLELGAEYATIAPMLPTFDDGTGAVDGEWICPYRLPYLLCAAHIYNVYRAYWFSEYYKEQNKYVYLEFILPYISVMETLYHDNNNKIGGGYIQYGYEINYNLNDPNIDNLSINEFTGYVENDTVVKAYQHSRIVNRFEISLDFDIRLSLSYLSAEDQEKYTSRACFSKVTFTYPNLRKYFTRGGIECSADLNKYSIKYYYTDTGYNIYSVKMSVVNDVFVLTVIFNGYNSLNPFKGDLHLIEDGETRAVNFNFKVVMYRKDL